MKAIGRVEHCDSRGVKSVTMFFDGNWQGTYMLENEMPANHPDFGLFEFFDNDDWCAWIDPDKE
jgi:hypothetical protein